MVEVFVVFVPLPQPIGPSSLLLINFLINKEIIDLPLNIPDFVAILPL